MTWWAWVIAGAILLGAELSFVNAQFYLVFVGSAAILTGLFAFFLPMAAWVPWALFGVLAIVSMLTFRARVYHHFNRALPPVETGPAGACIVLASALPARASGQAEFRGTSWAVRNESDRDIPAGGRARVTRVIDLTLLVRPEE